MGVLDGHARLLRPRHGRAADRRRAQRIVTIYDFSNCYVAQVVLPCERVVYRTGVLNVAFTFMVGLLLLVIAAWLLWELWLAVKPRPIADEFLKLLHHSFGLDWRNPLTWPWARLTWAYGFTLLGAASMAGAGVVVWTLASSSGVVKAPARARRDLADLPPRSAALSSRR